MSVPPPSSDVRRDLARDSWALLLLVGVALAVVAILWGVGSRDRQSRVVERSDSGRPPRSAYVGSKRCAECHPGEYASHSRSGHARTLRPAARIPLARRLSGATFADPERPGASWSYSLKDGQFQTELREEGEVERFVIDYAFGSGRHATTFVTLTDRAPEHPTMIEHRLSVYAHRELPDITPGQGQARGSTRQGDGRTGRRYLPPATLKCFECHTTTMSDSGPQRLDEAGMTLNIGCERCHGPGQSHIERARRGAEGETLAMPFGLGGRSTGDEIRLCGACHRLPETVDPAMIQPGNSGLVRFQPVGLMQSACYRKSRGALSCSTCHDPHARVSSDLSAYETVCLSCHQGAAKTACKVGSATGCVGCHMPRRDASRGMLMSDHWIRSRPETAVNSPPPPH
ncbi:MAG: multiheme c-type cytochrome [Isosphaeraceae bacterium]